MTVPADVQDHVFTTIIIGAGFSGLGAVMKLIESGVTDIAVLERADEVGGTWRDNTYPGVACDIPSMLYSYSFEQNPRWREKFASGAEIQEYIKDVVDRRDIRRYIRFGENVSGITWDEQDHLWSIQTATSTYRARAVIASYGPLPEGALPRIDGFDSFKGKVIHTARWDHDYDFAGKKVAVIGTGATGVQVIPELVRVAGQVHVFQRTPGWVMPRSNPATSARTISLFTRIPLAQRMLRFTALRASDGAALAVVWNTVLTNVIAMICRANLAKEVRDPWLRRRLTPNFKPGCKRMLMSSDYFPALQAPNCELVTWPISRISEDGVMTCEGVERRADVIVCATGYEVTKTAPPIRIVGRDGRSLDDEWSSGAFAYKSMNVAGYPNLFFTFGPNAGPGHTSALEYMEAEVGYAVKAIKFMLKHRLVSLEVRQEAQDEFNRWLQDRMVKTTWNSGGCQSWYLTDGGFNATMFPGFAATFRKMLKDIDLHDYIATGSLDEALSMSREMTGAATNGY